MPKTNTITWTIDDEKGENATGKSAAVGFIISFSVEPGDPGCRYDSNGDGYPGYDASVTINAFKCVGVHFEGEEDNRDPTAAEADMFASWIAPWLESQPHIRERIEAEARMWDEVCKQVDSHALFEDYALRGPFDHL